ncbi:MAG TPA: STAS domain-containing protein [Tepidisphaeraceae bacterium]|nr:STAS domain-containing protein [Tepidisphaeraceae bacterium]
MNPTPNNDRGLSLTLRQHNGAIVGSLSGEAGLDQEGLLRRHMKALAAGTEPLVVLELAGVTFLSSIGLRALLELRHELKAFGRRLVLANISPVVSSVLQQTKLNSQFEIAPTVDQGLHHS